MPQLGSIGKHATTVNHQEDYTAVQYYDTEVVKVYHDTTIELDTGGWFTQTTKTRMNQVAAQWGLNFHVFQRNHKWYVNFNGNEIPFDGDTVVLKP